MIPLEEQQQINLHCNWEVRKDLAVLIGLVGPYGVYRCKVQFGVSVFYIILNDIPIGYIHCYELPGYVQVTSTFITPVARRKGLGVGTYKLIILHAGGMMSDTDRTVGADALWLALKRDPSLDIQFERTGIDDDGYFTAKPISNI